MKKNSLQRGFTLIELLVVIAILGILVVGLIAAIDPGDKLNAANDARAKASVGVIVRAAESYAVANNNTYPAPLSATAFSSELKSIPSLPSGYTYTYRAYTATGACGSSPCVSYHIIVPLKSKQYTSTSGSTAEPPLAFWRYESIGSKFCVVATSTAADYC